MGEVNGGGGGQTRLGHHSVRRSRSLPIHRLLSLCLQGSAQAPPPPGGPGPSPPHSLPCECPEGRGVAASGSSDHGDMQRGTAPRSGRAGRRLSCAGLHPASLKPRDASSLLGTSPGGPALHLRLSPGGRRHVSFSPPSSTQPLWESSGSRGCWGPRQSLGCLRSRAAHRHVAFKKRNCLSYYFLKKFLHLLKKKTLKC